MCISEGDVTGKGDSDNVLTDPPGDSEMIVFLTYFWYVSDIKMVEMHDLGWVFGLFREGFLAVTQKRVFAFS